MDALVYASGANQLALMQDMSERLLSVELDETTIGFGLPVQASERGAAIADLIDHGAFRIPLGAGPYRLHLSRDGGKLVMDIRDADNNPGILHVLSISPLRRVVRDYFLICESYLGAIREGQHERVQTIDMARRGVHNEGAALLQERLAGKVNVDQETARLLFTLVASLAWTGREGG
jgi:uncharacterized protein (UPF0262 family)